MNFKSIAKSVSNFMSKTINDFYKTLDTYAPEIWAGAGIGLMITSGVVAVLKTRDAITEADAANPEDKPKIYAKHYALPAAGAAAGAGCIVMSVTTSSRRYLALTSAYKFADETLKTYKEKTLEVVGPKKEKEIQGKVAQQQLDDHPVQNNEVIVTGNGKSLCYDAYSGRYFEFDIGKLQRVENELNNMMIQENYISLNELYLELGLDPIDLGYELGWTIDKGKLIRFELSSKLTSEDKPCLVLNYEPAPSSEYYMLYQ